MGMMDSASIVDQSVASQVDVAAIKVVTDQLLTWDSSEGTLTADGTEQDVYINDTPGDEFYPHVVFIDLDNMQAGDSTDIKVYYRVVAAGGQQLYDVTTYAGADGGLAGSRKIIAVTLLPNRRGVRVTLQQTAGVNRDYPWQAVLED